MLKELATAVLAFTMPPAICVGYMALMIGRHPVGVAGQAFATVPFFVAPLAGYAVIIRQFGRWRDFDRPTMFFVVGLSAFYWIVYTPLWLYWLMVSAIGWAGGI